VDRHPYEGGRHDISLGLIEEAEREIGNPRGGCPAAPQVAAPRGERHRSGEVKIPRAGVVDNDHLRVDVGDVRAL